MSDREIPKTVGMSRTEGRTDGSLPHPGIELFSNGSQPTKGERSPRARRDQCLGE